MASPGIKLWTDDWGNICLPDDFPTGALTGSGWFDRRFKISEEARRYIAEQSKKLELGQEKSGFRAPSFVEWRAA